MDVKQQLLHVMGAPCPFAQLLPTSASNSWFAGSESSGLPLSPICVLVAGTTGKLRTVKLSHCLLSPGKQPGCLANGNNEVEVEVWKGGTERS